jgi:type I restriction enzyme, S subunit
MSCDEPLVSAIPNSWREVTIDQIKAPGRSSIAIGPFGSRMKADTYVPTGVPVVRGSNIGDTRELRGDFVFIPPALAETLKSSLLISGDLFFPHRGLIGEVGIVGTDVPTPCMLSTSLMKLSPDATHADSQFLFYFFRSPRGRHALLQNSSQVGTPGIATPLASLRRIALQLPGLPEQQAIARVLAVLDDRIDSNRRLTGLLEAAVVTLFRARFVSCVGVEGFERNEMGSLPPGWRIGALADLARFVNGKAFTKHANATGRPIVRIRELNGGVDHGTPRSDIEADDDFIARFDDILFAWSGSLGVYRWPGSESLINQHIFKVIPNGWPAWFVHAWIQEHMENFRGIARDRATTMGHIQRRHLTEARVPLPVSEAIASTHATVGPIDQQRAALVRENATLASVRDLLLPKLISGEIRVPVTSDPAEVIGPAFESLAAPGR